MILLANTQCLIIYYLFYFQADSIHIFHVHFIIVSYIPPVPIGSPSSLPILFILSSSHPVLIGIS